MIRLAAVFAVFFIACTTFPDEVPSEEKKDQNATSPPTSAQLPPSSTKSGSPSSSSSTDASTPTETSPPATDASAGPSPSSDAGAPTKDAAPAAKIAFGQSCTTHAQCADGLCLPFENKGLRCTKVCDHDDDCPTHDCKDEPQVCDID